MYLFTIIHRLINLNKNKKMILFNSCIYTDCSFISSMFHYSRGFVLKQSNKRNFSYSGSYRSTRSITHQYRIDFNSKEINLMLHRLAARGRKKSLLNDRCLKNIECLGFVHNLYIQATE